MTRRDADEMLAASNAVNAFYTAVGQRIQAHREAAGLTQTDLAVAVGLERASMSNIEAGRQRSSLHIFTMIAQVLRVTIGDLMPSAALPVGPVALGRPAVLKQMRALRNELDACIGQLEKPENSA